MSLLELFCDVDDFWQGIERQRQAAVSSRAGQALRKPGLCASEMMTILIHFHQSGYRCFKDYYQEQVLKHLRAEFPGAMSYSRFVWLMPRVVVLLWAYALYR